ncbi:MAG TPA: MFS transporter [Pseudonocardiaceae bacterium]|nr:MFS transporter [Pseudonocardiaceae bacterium]
MTATDQPAARAASAAPTRYRSTLWTREHRVTTIGLVLVVTVVAFEFMGVATALPTLVADLHGGRLYAWPIAAFTAAAAIGTVIGGRISDRRGPGGPLLGAIVLFGLGLLIGGTAHTMLVLLAGRVVQGLGAGTVVVAVYVVIGGAYPERDRPAASALTAAAWVVPSLVGPLVAGLVTEHFGWRWVFLGLVPLVAVAVPLLVPVVRKLPPHEPSAGPGRRGLLLAGVGAAVGVSVFTAAVQRLDVVTVPIAIGGVVLLAFALRRLLPAGTVRAARGLPSVVLSRGLLAGSFQSVEIFVPLALTSVHGFTPATAGLPLTASALGWSAAAAWQGRHPDVSRTVLLRIAFLLVVVGLGGITVIAFHGPPGWLAIPAWTVGGAGMGLGVSSISVLLLGLSPAGERGFNTSAMQLADMIGTVLLVGVGGVLVNTLGSTAHPTVPLFVFDVLMCLAALFGAIVPARRAAGRLP